MLNAAIAKRGPALGWAFLALCQWFIVAMDVDVLSEIDAVIEKVQGFPDDLKNPELPRWEAIRSDARRHLAFNTIGGAVFTGLACWSLLPKRAANEDDIAATQS